MKKTKEKKKKKTFENVLNILFSRSIHIIRLNFQPFIKLPLGFESNKLNLVFGAIHNKYI